MAAAFSLTTCWIAPARAVPSTHERLRAHGRLESTSPATEHRAFDIEMRLSESLSNDEASSSGGGTLTCAPLRYSPLPCPAATGRVSIEEAPGLVVGDPAVGRNLVHLLIGLDFGDTECALNAFSPFSLGGLREFGPKLRPPGVFFGTYACTTNGAESDHGEFTIWQHGPAHRVPSRDGF